MADPPVVCCKLLSGSKISQTWLGLVKGNEIKEGKTRLLTGNNDSNLFGLGLPFIVTFQFKKPLYFETPCVSLSVATK